MHRVKVKVVEDALDANETIARANRDDFDRAGVTVVNFMGAPGAGKTALLERVLLDWASRAGVLEGDVQGSLDADRLASLHVPVVQLQTSQGFGGECHLDANMVRSALPSLPLADIDLLVIENVGNLVCPAEFRVGEDARVMVVVGHRGRGQAAEVPADVPRVRAGGAEQDRPAAVRGLRRREVPRAAGRRCIRACACLQVSARTGEGMEAWREWLARLPGSAHDRGVAETPTFFAAHAERLARLCDEMAVRFLARRAAARARRVGPGAVGRAPRGGRVRAPGDRRQAGAAGAGRRGPGGWRPSRATS